MVQREATSNLMIFPGIDFHFGEAQYSLGGFGILLSNKYWGNYIVPCKLHNFVIGFHFITIHLCYVEEKVSIILFPILSPWMSFLFPTISIVTSATLAANHHCPFSVSLCNASLLCKFSLQRKLRVIRTMLDSSL